MRMVAGLCQDPPRELDRKLNPRCEAFATDTN